MSKPERLQTYFDEAGTWARDREKALQESRKMAWIGTAIAATIAIFEAIALILLVPLKTVEPYTLLVDRQTGYVEAIKPLDPQLIAPDTALTRSFLVQYVIAREGFDIDSLQSDYRKVALWSAGQARQSYLATMQPSNSQSPLARYPRDAVVEVTVKSVNMTGPTVAMVRFDTARHDSGGGARPRISWAAVVRYEYSDAPLSVEDRMVNPLGFTVQRYQRSAEITTEPNAAAEVHLRPAPKVRP